MNSSFGKQYSIHFYPLSLKQTKEPATAIIESPQHSNKFE